MVGEYPVIVLITVRRYPPGRYVRHVFIVISGSLFSARRHYFLRGVLVVQGRGVVLGRVAVCNVFRATVVGRRMADQSEDAAKQLKKYGFELNLNQKMSGESAGSNSTVKLDMQGRAELGPLKLDQTNKSDIDGEKSSLRAILVPDAYYMYSDEFKEWSKLSKEETANVVRTLSSLQINLAESIEGVRGLGSALAVKPSGDEIAISYNGNGPEALTFSRACWRAHWICRAWSRPFATRSRSIRSRYSSSWTPSIIGRCRTGSIPS
ncbi:DUF6612 family protein [Cohnella faecalis]|uniref:Uncharacterized protein n=1 Tax=Cohnella faecalis TaxID=2315694 RepID=A0A398CPP1_9BACL|nr:DUF6612 family protein [Cohnella faecalis]RIE04150.1 hypothetical protein D3H35_07840 [Cohnella faecalis]